VILEPLVQGAGGMRMHAPALVRAARAACDRRGLFLIADEVMTGFGRTGPLFASAAFDSPPDILCLSKGITGGSLPLGVTTTTARVFDAFVHPDRQRAFLHGHSYTGNPLACAAALASLDLLLTPECDARRASIESRHRAFASSIASHAAVRSVRVLGTVLAVTVRAEGHGGYFSDLRNQIMAFAIEQGVLLRPLGDVIYTLPPYCITDGQLDRVHEVIRRSLELIP
jgi:adenosylmethionine-8-amino-7-oxononanoate aminotransferase